MTVSPSRGFEDVLAARLEPLGPWPPEIRETVRKTYAIVSVQKE